MSLGVGYPIVIITIHTLFGLGALLAGAWNLLATKGTRRHRLVGWTYVGAMAGLVLTSFAIYDNYGRFGAFHVLSLVSGATLAMAMSYPLFRRNDPSWMESHYVWIGYSYIGLWMAIGSHFLQYVPTWPTAIQLLVFWGLPLGIGSALLFGQKRRTLARLQRPDSRKPAPPDV